MADNTITASSAATTARPEPMNSGDNPPTAIRVNGTVKEKVATPSRPHPRPPRLDSTAGTGTVALSCCDMANDSTDKIVTGLREWIASAPAGAKGPSSRALAAEYAASPVTVQNAMRKLTALGLIEARPGVGTFIQRVRGTQTVDYGWQTAALGAPQAHASLLSSTQRTIA